MNIDQARRLIALHDNADRALANLRNAGAMASDDSRSTEMLESAGDAYAAALSELEAMQTAIVLTAPYAAETPQQAGPSDAPSAPESASEDSEQGQDAEDPQTGADAAS